MAKFPKSSGIAKGENSNGFRSVGGAGYSNRDPTQQAPKPKNETGMSWPWNGGNSVNGDGWKRWEPSEGSHDSQGGEHDW
jgi:hypothetical protein